MDFRRWDPGSEGKVCNRADLSHDNKIGMIWFRYGISAKRARRDLRRDIRYRGNMGFERIPLYGDLWIGYVIKRINHKITEVLWHKVSLLKIVSSDMKVGSSMAPSTHSNSKAMFRLADQKRTDSECTPLQILKPIVISEVIFMMLLATLGWLMVILSIHVRYYALRKAQLSGKYWPICSLKKFFRSVKVVLIQTIKSIGYCSEDTKSFLLWKQRLEIMLRAAQGLAYLHELQALVWLTKGIGDNTHFVTARVPEETTMHLGST
ncbi:hypothetical protein Bca4012_098973 [Brassica carinata]